NNMPEHLEVLTQVLTVEPDFVLLQLYINDFETPSMARPQAYPLLPASLERRVEGSSLIYDMARAQWTRIQEAIGLTEGYVHYMERNLRDPDAPNAKKAYGQLREFFERARAAGLPSGGVLFPAPDALGPNGRSDRKSTRLNSSHVSISYAVFCLKKKNCRDCLSFTRRL